MKAFNFGFDLFFFFLVSLQLYFHKKYSYHKKDFECLKLVQLAIDLKQRFSICNLITALNNYKANSMVI